MTRGGPGLFEALTGHFANGDPIGLHDRNQQTFLSVRDNIQRILNSRRESLAHLPDYGLGDLSKIYRHMPASAHTPRREIEDTLLKYEPRLKSIDIASTDPEESLLLNFTMSCELHQVGLVRYGTYFTADGQARLTTHGDID
ncbi:type VI secretion system baseplate subunit TssE [Caballeronia sp. SEWSISQ10-4 2]|uniref:type VI secretion system baseplate subunit TssE n=1 Tax=Caballeronia sp. SEWSISQ10-4 2 TaxID=2937438 RepID=UPI00264CCB5E|nr:type VI secretion system baseplate subunit TssE [Caballeronia sp. SEWSISQ10-4 2]MDN7178528.1 type VI secretion system baseplate subunit TssE [Caballeronia sp. SEWSISQ10-4 2]